MGKIQGPIELTILEVGPQKATPNGNIYVESSFLKNGRGERVAFWGTDGKNARNLKSIIDRKTPFKVTASFGWTPNAEFSDQHSLWIPEAADLAFID